MEGAVRQGVAIFDLIDALVLVGLLVILIAVYGAFGGWAAVGFLGGVVVSIGLVMLWRKSREP